MPHGLGRLFAAGIVWDDREPLPLELQHGHNHNTSLYSVAHHVLRPGNPPYRPVWGRHNVPGGLNLTAFAVQPLRDSVDAQIAPFGADVTNLTQLPPQPHLKALPELTVQEHDRNVLPPLSISLDASIVQDTARITVTQVFWNDSSRTIKEAAYTFPLPTGCSVTDFSCRIGATKIIKGNVRPKGEAREAFQHHIRHKITSAALLEQDTPEIFTTTLGNIPEKTKIKVHLSFVTLLKHHFADRLGNVSLTIPTYIASRYGSPPDGYNNAESTNVPQGLTLKVEVTESEKVRSITSDSHRIAVERRLGRRNAESFADLAGDEHGSNVETAVVQLKAASAFLDKDFLLAIVTESDSDSEAPQAWLEDHPTLPNHKALMLTLPPRSLGQSQDPTTARRSEILFLVDRSGSMSDKIESLKSSMHFFLKGIPQGRTFNIWSFGTHYESWSRQSVDYTEASLAAALAYVKRNFRSDMGGTELLPAIQAIVAARDRSVMTDVIVLTDGQTWRLDQTLDFVQQTRMTSEGRVRFFSLGIGDGVSHALVEGIAKAGGGYAEVIPASVRNGWEDRVVSMLKTALTTDHLGPLQLQFRFHDKDGNSSASSLPDAQRSPSDISTLTPFNHSRVYFLFDSVDATQAIDSVTIRAPSRSITHSVVVPVTRLEKKDTTIHKLAARSLLEDLERGQSPIHLGPNKPYPGSWDETNRVRKAAEEIACKWSLVSKWTSFFLVEEPYVPAGDDPFMDGVIEVRETPGDDLLRPRGNAKDFAAIEAASVEVSLEMVGETESLQGENAVSRLGNVVRRTAASNNYPCHEHGSSRPDSPSDNADAEMQQNLQQGTTMDAGLCRRVTSSTHIVALAGTNTYRGEDDLNHGLGIHTTDTNSSTRGNRRKVIKALMKIATAFGTASPDQFDDTRFRQGKAAGFPEIPGEGNRNRKLNQIRQQWGEPIAEIDNCLTPLKRRSRANSFERSMSRSNFIGQQTQSPQPPAAVSLTAGASSFLGLPTTSSPESTSEPVFPPPRPSAELEKTKPQSTVVTLHEGLNSPAIVLSSGEEPSEAAPTSGPQARMRKSRSPGGVSSGQATADDLAYSHSSATASKSSSWFRFWKLGQGKKENKKEGHQTLPRLQSAETEAISAGAMGGVALSDDDRNSVYNDCSGYGGDYGNYGNGGGDGDDGAYYGDYSDSGGYDDSGDYGGYGGDYGDSWDYGDSGDYGGYGDSGAQQAQEHPQPPGPAPQAAPSLTEAAFIRHLLTFQQYDGSFVFPTPADAASCLGKPIAGALSTRFLEAQTPWDVAWVHTTAVVHLLERDFGSCRALWAMMAWKAEQWLANNRPPTPEAARQAGTLWSSISDLPGPLHSKGDTDAPKAKAEKSGDCVDESDATQVDEDDEAAAAAESALRELVERAPSD